MKRKRKNGTIRLTMALVLAVLCMASTAFYGCDISVLYADDNDNDYSVSFLTTEQFELKDDDYSFVEKKICYPEGTDEDDAQYVLEYLIPVFNDTVANNAQLNAAVSMFESELIKRVEDERLPYADRVEGEPAPFTRVTCELDSARGFINAVFLETSSFGGEEHVDKSCMVMHDNGLVSLGEASGAYDAGERAAQQVLNRVAASAAADADDADIDYYDDLTLADVANAIDVFYGYRVTDTGYILFFDEGVLASGSYGKLEIPVTVESLYPDVVGDKISVSDYERIRPLVDKLVTAAYANDSGFVSGKPDSSLATAFMLQIIVEHQTALNVETLDDGGLYMEREAFLQLFGALFDVSFPGMTAVGLGRIESDDQGFTLYPANTFPPYRFSMSDVMIDGDMLTAIGEIMFGEPDGAVARMSGAELMLRRDTTSPFGYKFVSLAFN